MKKKTTYQELYSEEDTPIEPINTKTKGKINLPHLKLSKPKVAGIVLMSAAFLAMVLVMPLTSYLKSGGETQIVVAAKDLDENTIIDAGMLKEIRVPKGDLMAQFAISASDIIGKYTKSFVSANEPFSFNRLSDAPTNRDQFLYDLPIGKQAISVSLANMAASVTGKIQPKDIVTVFACPTSNETSGMAVQPLELKYVEVLDVFATQSASTTDENDASTPQLATVTLLVNDRQAAILAFFDKTSPVHLSLTCRGDKNKAIDQLKQQDEILLSLEQDATLLRDDVEVVSTDDPKEDKESAGDL